MSIFDVTTGNRTLGEKARAADDYEVKFYLRWLAERRGVPVLDRYTIDKAGIYDPSAKAYVLDMPGYGVQSVATMEVLDENGETIRTTPLATDSRGRLVLSAKQIADATGLKAVRVKAAKKVAQPAPSAVAPIAPAAPEIAPSEAKIAPLAVVEPVAEIAPAVATVEAVPTPDVMLERADRMALAALVALGITTEPGAHPDAEPVWRAYVMKACGLPNDNWVFTQGQQRDRKARNRGKVVLPDPIYRNLLNRFNDLLPPVVEPEAVAPIAATVAPDVPAVAAGDDLRAMVERLARRVADLERGTLAARPPRTASHLRAIRAYLALRAERTAHRQLQRQYATGIEQFEQATRDLQGLRTRVTVVSEERDAALREGARAHVDHSLAARELERVEQELAAERAATGPLRQELARLAPLANAIAALTNAPPPPVLAIAA